MYLPIYDTNGVSGALAESTNVTCTFSEIDSTLDLNLLIDRTYVYFRIFQCIPMLYDTDDDKVQAAVSLRVRNNLSCFITAIWKANRKLEKVEVPQFRGRNLPHNFKHDYKSILLS